MKEPGNIRFLNSVPPFGHKGQSSFTRASAPEAFTARRIVDDYLALCQNPSADMPRWIVLTDRKR